MKLNINYRTLLNIINLNYGVYKPVNTFVSKKDFLSILKNYTLSNGKFFPIPLFITVSKQFYNKNKNKKLITVFYKSKKVCNLSVKSYYELNKQHVGKKIFSTNNKNHPGFSQFLKSDDYFVDCKIINFNRKIMKNINFTFPKKTKSIFLKNKLKTIVGFHTRNVPHRAHEWIHGFGLKKCEGLFLHPLIGQFKKKEYKEKIIIKSHLKLINDIYKNKKVFFGLFNSYPMYGGPREALLHAIVRRNYGCTHFMLGRDHAGVGKYYKKYASQNLCMKYQRSMKIKIIAFAEPYLCKICKKIVNKKCDNCNKVSKKLISGTLIRNLILKKLEVPEIYMRKSISRLLKPNLIIS